MGAVRGRHPHRRCDDRGEGGHLSVGDPVAVGRRRCPRPWQRMVVAPTGEVMPCCADWRKEWVIGDARSQSLKEIWKGPKMEAMRNIQREMQLDQVSPCRTCFVPESYAWEEVAAADTPPGQA